MLYRALAASIFAAATVGSICAQSFHVGWNLQSPEPTPSIQKRTYVYEDGNRFNFEFVWFGIAVLSGPCTLPPTSYEFHYEAEIVESDSVSLSNHPITWLSQLATLKQNPNEGYWTFSCSRGQVVVQSNQMYEDLVAWKQWSYVIPSNTHPNNEKYSAFQPLFQEWIYLEDDSSQPGGFRILDSAARTNYDKIELVNTSRLTDVEGGLNGN